MLLSLITGIKRLEQYLDYMIGDSKCSHYLLNKTYLYNLQSWHGTPFLFIVQRTFNIGKGETFYSTAYKHIQANLNKGFLTKCTPKS